MYSISDQEPRERYRHIELNGRDDGNGIQITLFDDHADVRVPYWHSGHAARQTFAEIWRNLGFFERGADYAAYDGQLDKIIDLTQDFDAVVARYERVITQLPKILASDQNATATKPWWKFW